MTRESAPKGASPILAAQRDHEQSIAQARARALAFANSAVAEGIWPITPSILNAIATLAWQNVFDWDLAAAVAA